jgi:succinate-acetate transporter protein
MDSNVQSTALTDATANPAPLGLAAFGLTTLLLNLANAGLYPLDAMILAMGIFYGGLAQVIAGIMEWRKGNTFGTTAFTSYGFFWLSLAGILALPKLNLANAPGSVAMGTYLAVWGIFTAILFLGTLRINRALQWVFATLVALFFLLAIGDWTGSTVVKMVAGWEGVVCGGTAIYAGLAQVLNEIYGRTIWPLGPVSH